MAEETKNPPAQPPGSAPLDTILEQVRKRTNHSTSDEDLKGLKISPEDMDSTVSGVNELHKTFRQVKLEVAALVNLYDSLHKEGVSFIKDNEELKKQFSDVADFMDKGKDGIKAQLDEINRLETSLVKVGAQVASIKNQFNLSTQAAINMARELKKADLGKRKDSKAAEVQAELTALDLLYNKMEQRRKLALRKADKDFDAHLKKADKDFDAHLKKAASKNPALGGITMGSFFKNSMASKGSILGSLMGNTDPNDIGSIMMGRYAQRKAYTKEARKYFGEFSTIPTASITAPKATVGMGVGIQAESKAIVEGVAAGMDKSKAAGAIEETASNTQTLETDAKVEMDRDYASILDKRLNRYGALGDGTAFAGAATVGATATGGAAFKSASDYLSTAAAGGPVGIIKGVTDGITAGITKMTPKGGAVASSGFGLLLTALSRRMQVNVAQAQANQIAFAQSGGLSRKNYMPVNYNDDLGLATTAQYSGVVDTIGGKRGDPNSLKALEGVARVSVGIQDDAAAADIITNIASSMDDVVESTKQAEKSYLRIAQATEKTSVNAKQFTQWTAQAAAAARLLNVDFKAVETISTKLLKNNSGLLGLGVNLKTMGGDILKDLATGAQNQSMGFKAYIGQQYLGATDPFEAIGKASFGRKAYDQMEWDGKFLRAGKGGQQTDKQYLIEQLKAEQEFYRDIFNKAGGKENKGKGIAAAEIAGQQFGRNSMMVRTLLGTDFDTPEGESKADSFGDTNTLLSTTLSVEQRTEKILSKISDAVIAGLQILLSLPALFKAASIPGSSDEASKWMDEQLAKFGAMGAAFESQGGFAYDIKRFKPTITISSGSAISSGEATNPNKSKQLYGYEGWTIKGSDGKLYKYNIQQGSVGEQLPTPVKKHSGGFLSKGSLGVLQFGESLQNLKTDEYAMIAGSDINVKSREQVANNTSNNSTVNNHYHFNGAILDGNKLIQYIEETQAKGIL